MATITFSIDTKATGPKSLPFELTEPEAQAIFAMLLGTASPITEMVDGEDKDEDGNPIKVPQERAKTLGECLRDEVGVFLHGVCARAVSFAKDSAAKAAADKATFEITPVEIAPMEKAA